MLGPLSAELTVDTAKLDEALARVNRAAYPMLMRLLKADPVVWSIGSVGSCVHCNAVFTDGQDHRPDCPYVEAVTLFGTPDEHKQDG